MSRTCVCQGENENCCWCGGFGAIPDERVIAPAAYTYDWPYPRLNLDRGSGNLVACPQGRGVRINPSKTNRRLRKAHGLAGAPSGSPTSRRSPTVNRP